MPFLSPVVGPHSQPKVLAHNLFMERVLVGQVIRATLSDVAVHSSTEFAPTIFFCASRLSVLGVMVDNGDDTVIVPTRVVARGLRFPSVGYWDIVSVIIEVGSKAVVVRADEETYMVPRTMESVAESVAGQPGETSDNETEIFQDARDEEGAPVLIGAL